MEHARGPNCIKKYILLTSKGLSINAAIWKQVSYIFADLLKFLRVRVFLRNFLAENVEPTGISPIRVSFYNQVDKRP